MNKVIILAIVLFAALIVGCWVNAESMKPKEAIREESGEVFSDNVPAYGTPSQPTVTPTEQPKPSPTVKPIPKPLTPDFTIQYINASYYIPPTYGIDPFNGENITTSKGRYVDNRSLIVTIRNQPFTEYTDENGNEISLRYNLYVKGHFQDDWSMSISIMPDVYFPSSREYTKYQIILGQYSQEEGLKEVSSGDQLDFRAQTQIGYYTTDTSDDDWGMRYWLWQYIFHGEKSDFSAIQTLTIP